MAPRSSEVILVTGATGYVWGRLVPRLIEAGHRVRCLARDALHLGGRAWAKEVEIVQGEMADANSLREIMDGVSVVYYLIHSLREGGDFCAMRPWRPRGIAHPPRGLRAFHVLSI